MTSHSATVVPPATGGPGLRVRSRLGRADPSLRTSTVSVPSAAAGGAAILEVLAGVRPPTEVAGQLAISTDSLLHHRESRLAGADRCLRAGGQRGKVRTPASELAALRRGGVLRRQARGRALLRVTEPHHGPDPRQRGPSFSQIKRTKSQEAAAETEARVLLAAAVLQEAAPPAASPDNGVSP